ncbi:hypothetical protein CAT7_04979 [Carnobacterium sp. AT7]|uniref:hypothetical protein n=1 Tax=Carnobacterium sp. AT7 TaxID=333990 RepID=UPI00015F199B|nr:hypothetical protein [Carnobacterium sp. AT7]EDP68592.1 hypothetical protein CAT7_04979 [Carnobacterium sp. AT7]
MNKRTKNKIAKRVIKNITKGKPLSEFDKKYSDELEKKILRKTEHHERFTSGILNAQTIDVRNIRLIAPEIQVESRSNQKETSWDKVKSKVKGWFGK